MLEMTVFVATALLVIREFLALEQGSAARRGTRLVGLAAIPFVLAFAVLFTLRVVSYLRI
jgi:hypothetical protein